MAVIIDVFSRQLVGWLISERLTSDYVISALANAIRVRRPSAGVIFHSDRGYSVP